MEQVQIRERAARVTACQTRTLQPYWGLNPNRHRPASDRGPSGHRARFGLVRERLARLGSAPPLQLSLRNEELELWSEQ